MGAGARLKAVLQEKGITIKQLADKTGISVNTLYSITKRDSERISFDIALRIADILKVDINWLRNGYTLEERDQAMKHYVARRFAEAESWKTWKDKLDMAFNTLNQEGQQKAVERVEELAEIPKYQRTPKPETPSEGK